MRVLLETDRLTLRRFTEADVDNLVDLDSEPDVMRFLTGGAPTPHHVVRDVVLPKILHYYEHFRGLGYWAAEEKSGGRFLGWFEFRPMDEARPDEVELGYRLRRAVWGKGYATEGSLVLIRKGFTELGVRRVVATTMAVNTRSRRVMEKVGLTLVRTFHVRWPEPIDGSEHGEVEYALTSADWKHRQAGAAAG